VPKHNSRPLVLHGAIGAVIGMILAVAVVLVIDRLAAGPQNDDLWLPAGIALGIVGGGVLGMLFTELVIGGREDLQADIRAKEAIRTARDRGSSPR
jgi:hypothetical protein